MVVVLLLVSGFIAALDVGQPQQDLVACYKLQSYEQHFPLFEATDAEREGCDAIGVSIDAPVK